MSAHQGTPASAAPGLLGELQVVDAAEVRERHDDDGDQAAHLDSVQTTLVAEDCLMPQ